MDGNVWIVGKSLGPENTWEFVGVFDSLDKALAACRYRHHFVAPALLNQAAPEEPIAWEGLRWPIAEQE